MVKKIKEYIAVTVLVVLLVLLVLTSVLLLDQGDTVENEQTITGSILQLKFHPGSRHVDPYYELMVGTDGSKRYIAGRYYKDVEHLFNPYQGAKLAFRDVEVYYIESELFDDKYTVTKIMHQGDLIYDRHYSPPSDWKSNISSIMGVLLVLFLLSRLIEYLRSLE
ncbi:hypothetical protein [Vibrio sp. RE88]|uniref:hypothetical protein n=1 Tax=Vibrio sp. RE88 TaxID=2607610 RepID=UPI00149349D4|nr:hypothetical protein [Vibrio sp. RE88]NOH61630.1 hypothetical protein [Vibrio sp. RE88]